MNENKYWKTSFDAELNQAVQARQAGNEGMARVCARRAAGIAVAEYLRRNNLPELGPSAYDHLSYLLTLPGAGYENLEIAEHLLMRVTKEHKLPIEVDLIEEARILALNLLGDAANNSP